MNILHKVTLQSLKRNKTRTIVTIIGVILSIAMLTAVTTLISSLQNYLIDAMIASGGNWHAEIYNVDKSFAQQAAERGDIEETAVVYEEGYAQLEGGQNKNKPYLYVSGMDEHALNMLSVHLLSGKLPQNGSELVIPEHISSNGGVTYQVGDTLTLDIGERVSSDGNVLGQDDPYDTANQESKETLKTSETKTYTIVGICRRLGVESYAGPGYMVVTKMDMENIPSVNQLTAYLKLKKPADVYKVTTEIAGTTHKYEYNNDLLRFMGISNDGTFLTVLYSLAGILIALILLGSIALIYNAFAISVSQRSQQFGLLSSIGATKKQLARSVLFEAFFICCIGIPAGLLVGIGGIGTTLFLIRDMFDSIIAIDGASLHLTVSFTAVAISVALGMLTVLISAYVPARRASRMSAMDAIRGTDDVKIKAKTVKTWKITRRLFGLEGDLARKNFKRNRRRYRSTVLSLFMSIVLFIGASAFGMYLSKSAGSVVKNVRYDISYNDTNSEKTDSIALFDSLRKMEAVEEGAWFESRNMNLNLSQERLTETGRRIYTDSETTNGSKPSVLVNAFIVDDETFAKYAQSIGQDPKNYFDTEQPKAIIVDNSYLYDRQTKRYELQQIMLHDLPFTMEFTRIESKDASANPAFAEDTFRVAVGAFATEAPMGVDAYIYSGTPLLIMPNSTAKTVLINASDDFNGVQMVFTAKNHTNAMEQMKAYLSGQGHPTSGLYDLAESLQNSRNLLTIVNIFSYGFIVLISLITIANVFNTISTNLHLRQREFAMLQSVGMTSRGFHRMMNYECILYGLKGLIYGLPTAFLIVYLIYISVDRGVDSAFAIPWGSVIISVLSVFLIVFISMLYSMREIKKKNVIDALKNENL